MAPRALPWATDLLGFQPAQGRRQGFFRTISTYLIFLDFEHPTLRGRCANMQRRSEAKHCSSLCSQSEGGANIMAAKHKLKIQESHAPDFRYVAVALTLRAK